jgi:hypothetical protein
MLRIYQNGQFYLVNEKNQIHGGPNNVKPDNSWILTGAVEFRTVFGNTVVARRYSADDVHKGKVPWRYKNGNQRCFLCDLDHGTMRTWMNPTPYWTEGHRTAKLPKTLRTAENTVIQIRDILWPNGDKDHEWSADTLDEIAQAMADYRPE